MHCFTHYVIKHIILQHLAKARIYCLLSLEQVEGQQVGGASMLDYADLDVECLERRGTHGQHRRDYVPTEYADIEFSRPAEPNRGNDSQYAD